MYIYILGVCVVTKQQAQEISWLYRVEMKKIKLLKLTPFTGVLLFE